MYIYILILGTNRICREHFSENMGMEFSFIDFNDIENVRAHIKSNTKLIFSETPTNPTLTLVDLDAVSALAKEHNLLHCVDSTFATPIICRPLDHGADLVVQSTTKFYDGHNITVGGAVIAATEELDARMHHVQNMHGNIMSPMNAFLQLQTIKTMGLRVTRQSSMYTYIHTYTFITLNPCITHTSHHHIMALLDPTVFYFKTLYIYIQSYVYSLLPWVITNPQ